MEQKIKNQENEIINLQLIFNNIRDGLIVIDRNENIQFINKAAKKILGVSNQKINGDHIRKYIKNSKRSEEHTSELQSRGHLVCRLLLEKKKSEESS